MSRIASVFSQSGRKALIPYVTVGYPTIEATMKVVPLLAQNGADIIELGIPFSDPLADGVTIQRSSFHALEKGISPRSCLDIAKQLRQQVDIPLVYKKEVLAYLKEIDWQEKPTLSLPTLIGTYPSKVPLEAVIR